MPSSAIAQVRSTAKLLQLHAPLLSGNLSAIEQMRATAALLDSLPELTPKRLGVMESMRYSAELLEVRTSLESGKLNPIEQVRASARGLELRAILGAASPVEPPAVAPQTPEQIEGQAAFDRAKEFYLKHLKAQVVQSVIGPVLINGTGWKKAKHGMKADTLKARLIEHVADILKTGTAGARQDPSKVRNDGFVGFYFIQKEVQVDDLLVTAGVTVAEDERGNLFYNVSHSDRESWKAYKNGVPDTARVGPRSGNADSDMLDGAELTVADGDINITIVAITPAPVQRPAPTVLITEKLPQKNGGVLVVGDPDALADYAQTYLDQAKYTKVATGLMLTKSQARLAQYLPTSKYALPAGGVIYTYADIGGVSVAVGRELSGIARDLPELKSLVAQQWGPEKFRAVFGEDAAPADVEAYEAEQAAITQRKSDNAAGDIEKVAAAQREKDVAQALANTQAEELARTLALQEHFEQENFAKTIGAGTSENPIYQAYLDTLEELPTNRSNAGFLGWAGIRAGEFERQSKGRVSADKAGYQDYVRQWADTHLSERVKAVKAAEPAPVEPVAVKPTITGTGTQFISPNVLAEPPEVGAIPVYGSRREFLVLEDGLMVMDESKRAAIVHAYGKTGPATVRAHAREYNAGRRWILNGEKIVPTDADQDPEPPAAQHEIIEYKTKKDKILRGIIRTDLSFAEAKAIDPYTWRMNGGYFIREKHLEGETAHIQAAPAPVVLSPEQQAEKAATDERVAEERRQKALGSQVEKLRTVANKAVVSGDAGMGQDRNTNTARRAGMAASAIAKASANKADGQTLNNIADAIEVGAAGLLTKLSSRAQLEELQRSLRLAQYETDRPLSYSDQLKRKGRRFDDDDLKNVTLPSQVTWASRFQSAAKAIQTLKPQGNARLITALTKMGARAERFTMNAEDAAITRKANDVLKGTKESHTLQDPMESIARLERLARMGISDNATLQAAARELLPFMVAKTEESAVKKAERAIIGQKVGIDFFPTPAHVAQRMARLAGITQGMRVLEPSAGNGNLADAAKSAGGEVDVIEISSQLRDILTAKGYTVVDHNFDSFTPEQPYQAILMNPPFSARQDASHIMRAFGMLAGGGRLVAIAGEGVFFGTDQKAVAFRAWLDTHNATVEKLEGGTFKDKDLLAQTGANGRLIVLKK